HRGAEHAAPAAGTLPRDVRREALPATGAAGKLAMAARRADLHPQLLVRRALPEPAGLVDHDGLDPGDEVHDRSGHGGDVGHAGFARGRRLLAHGRSFVSTSVACAAWNPPWPATTHTCASGT